MMEDTLEKNIERLAKYLEAQIKENSKLFNQDKVDIYSKLNKDTQEMSLFSSDSPADSQAFNPSQKNQAFINGRDSEHLSSSENNYSTSDSHPAVKEIEKSNFDSPNETNATNVSRPHSEDSHSLLSKRSKFYSREIPDIGITEYLKRIYKYCPFGNNEILSLIVYFERIRKKNLVSQKRLINSSIIDPPGSVEINAYSVHRLLISLVCITCKFQSDTFFTNTRYAKVGGVSVKEMNSLELCLLLLVDFNLYIDQQELLDAYEFIKKF
ncbi:PHO85 cyclin-7 [Smittium mucronatum]|uniref:PHO85 cyclin-7 n=1 Tax=Smittium mucronatum TaxID=133383 RepID=A0A1R0H7H8_9FUNG|nr:PHO85 cyclin-7 [Smittium mucronatum]